MDAQNNTAKVIQIFESVNGHVFKLDELLTPPPDAINTGNPSVSTCLFDSHGRTHGAAERCVMKLHRLPTFPTVLCDCAHCCRQDCKGRIEIYFCNIVRNKFNSLNTSTKLLLQTTCSSQAIKCDFSLYHLPELVGVAYFIDCCKKNC